VIARSLRDDRTGATCVIRATFAAVKDGVANERFFLVYDDVASSAVHENEGSKPRAIKA
jgi:hypothetical protein